MNDFTLDDLPDGRLTIALDVLRDLRGWWQAQSEHAAMFVGDARDFGNTTYDLALIDLEAAGLIELLGCVHGGTWAVCRRQEVPR